MTLWTPLLAVHAFAATTALPLGAYQLLRKPKGDVRHRLVGWVWVLLMLFVASSSFFIRDLRHGRFSLLHVLSVVTLVTTVLGVRAARRGNIAAHRGNLRGGWFGLCGAFVGAVAVPQRAIPRFVLADPGQALAAVATVAVVTLLVVRLPDLVGRMQARPRKRPAVG